MLELACGPGGLGLAAAARVAPGGEVVLSDVAAEMTAIAAARAGALGLANVSTRELDLESIDQPDDAYDVVLCREGLMFATDPARAAREIRRVLRPGGRVALAVWGPRERNPWLGVVFDAVSAQIGRPVPPPGIPGPFSLADSDGLGALLTDAGLADVVVERAARAPAGRLLRGVVGADVRAGRAARADARVTARSGRPGAPCPPARRRPSPTGRPPGWSFPGVSLIAAARR